MRRIENGKIEGNYLVEGELTLNGMITGTTTVVQGSLLHLHGMCCGDLVVLKDATAIVSGTVIGNLLNQGHVELRGVVKGSVQSRDGYFKRAPGAVVEGRIET